MRRAWVATIVVAAWAGGVLADEDSAPMGRIHFTISAETTRVVGPVRADGTVDYVEAINAVRLKDKSTPNAAAGLVRVLGKEAWAEPVRNKVFAKLGIEAMADEVVFVPLKRWLPRQDTGEAGGGARKVEQANDWLVAGSESPWKKESFPDLAAWLKSQDQALDAASAAVGTAGQCVFPAVSSNPAGTYAAICTPPLADLMSLGQALVIRAMGRLEGQDYAGCWSDLRAAHRLARCVGQGNNMIERLAAYQMEHIAYRGTAELLRDEQMPAAGYKGMVADLQRMGPLPGLGECLDRGERYLGLDSVMMAIRSGQGPVKDAATAALSAVKWDDVLKDMNHLFDAAVTAADRPTREERVKAAAEFDALARALKPAEDTQMDLTVRLSGTLRSYVAPSVTMLLSHYEAIGAEDDLLLVGAALAAYRAEQGKYPESPADVTPEYLKAIPTDRFSDGLLQYKTTARGYVLYSVGPDGKDDEGRDLQRGKGDIVLRVRGR